MNSRRPSAYLLSCLLTLAACRADDDSTIVPSATPEAGSGAEVEATVELEAPDVTITLDEDTAVTFDLSVSSSPRGAKGIKIVIEKAPAHGTLVVTETGYTYTPEPDFNGDDTLEYSGGIGANQSNTGTITLSVTPQNDAPSFTGTNVSANEDAGSQTLPMATGIFAGPANESDQTLTFTVTNDNNALFSTQPAISPSTGNVTFTPAANANGTAQLTVTLSDGAATVTQTFTLTLNAVNDAPAFTKGANQALLEDAPAQSVAAWATGFSRGAANESAQTLAFTASSTNPSLFSVQPAVSANGTLTYKLAPNVSGLATVTVTLSDNGGTANGGVSSVTDSFTVTVTPVNDAPFFTGPIQVVLEDSAPQAVTGWATGLAGPSDESGQTFTIELLGNDNPGLFTVEPGIDASGTLTYAPAPDASGYARLSISLADDGGTANGGVDTALQDVYIHILPVNTAPSFTKGAEQSVMEGTSAQTIAGWATGMSVGPANEAWQTYRFSAANNNPSLFSVQPAVAVDGTLTYTLAPDAEGLATVTLSLIDSGGTVNGGVDAVTDTFAISVTAVNDAPAFTKGANQTRLEDAGAITVAGWATNLSSGPANEAAQSRVFVVSNDNNGLFSAQPTVSTTGVLSYTVAANTSGSATVTVAIQDNGGNANGGVDTSADQTFTITVTPVNDVPSFTKGANEARLEDAAAVTVNNWATNLSSGPADESAQTMAFAVTNTNNALFAVQPAVSSAGVLTYTPAADASGSALVSVTLQDNGGTANGGVNTSAGQTFTITVTAVNDVPSFNLGADPTSLEDATAVTLTDWATELSSGPANESAQTLVFLVSNDNNGLFAQQPTLSTTGVLSYTPATDANGSATVTVALLDNGGTANAGVDTSAEQTFTITVTPVNEPPSFTKGADEIRLEDAGAVTVSDWATDLSKGPANESTQTLVFGVSNDNTALFAAQPTVSSDGVLTYTPADHANGSATVTVSVQDDGGTNDGGVDTSAEQTFTITITAVNDAPSFTKGADQTPLEDAAPVTLAGWATNLSTGPTDESAQSFVFLVSNDNNSLFAAQPTLSTTGTLSYTLAADATGSATVTIAMQDDGGTGNGGVDTSADQTFTITVLAVNEAPSFTKGAEQVRLEDTGAFSVDGWATNIASGSAAEAAQSLSFLVSNDNNALFAAQPTVSSTGVLAYTLAPNANGSATVSVTIQDDGGTANGGVDTSAAQTFAISVTAVNDAPSFTKGADQALLEDASAVALNGWASDLSGGPADESQSIVFVVSNDNNSLFAVQPTVSTAGVLSFTLAADANGSGTVTVAVKDDGGTANGGVDASAAQTFAITVTAVNDAPSFTKGADQTPLEDAAPVSLSGWATNLSDGPADESQAFVFVVSNDNNALFAAQPTVSTAGVLAYTLAADATGTATVTVSMKDAGGSANGGDDQSNDQTFTITVTPVNDDPTDISIGSSDVDENLPSGEFVGVLSATDADADDTFTYALVAGTGDADNATFNIVGGVLETVAPFDFESQDTFLIRVQVTDSELATFEKQFTITVNDINEEPSVSTVSIDGAPFHTADTLGITTGGWADPEGASEDYLYLWYKNGVSIPTQTGATLTGGTFAKTDFIKVLATPFDGELIGTPTFSNEVEILNSIPSFSGVSLGSGPFYVGDQLTATATGFADADGDLSQTTLYFWFVDGAAAGSAQTLNNGFARGNTVTVAAVPYDGTAYGPTVTASAETILNSAPVFHFNELSATPAPAREGSTLSAQVNVSDNDSDSLTQSYEWYKNDVATGISTTTLDGTNFNKGDVLKFRIAADDGFGGITVSYSNAVTIEDSPTTPAYVTLSPAVPATDSVVVATLVTAATDVDPADTYSGHQLAWYVDGSLIYTAPGSYGVSDTAFVLPATYGTYDVLRVVVTPIGLAATGTTHLEVPFTRVATGNVHTCALTLFGTVSCWGSNGSGEQGNLLSGPGTSTNRLTSRVVGIGGGYPRALTISVGLSTSCAILEDGSATCWGPGNAGSRGDGSTAYLLGIQPVAGMDGATYPKPVSISTRLFTTCATMTDGSIRCWGAATYGQLGEGTTTYSAVPVTPTGLDGTTYPRAATVATGDGHVCALLTDGTIRCWGQNQSGQLGTHDDTYTNTSMPGALVEGIGGASLKAVDLAAGDDHNCALIEDGTVKCWGSNLSRELGDTSFLLTKSNIPRQVTTITGGSPRVIRMALFANASCLLFDDGSEQCWGENSAGTTGSNAGTRSTPTQVVGLTGSPAVTSISGGTQTSCAVLDTGKIKCWGWNFYGQVGDTTTTDAFTPQLVRRY